jgi:hypothetical protein
MSFEDIDDTNDRHERRIVRCRSCSAKIIFLETAAGRKMPVDADTVESDDETFDGSRHTSHFAVCPAADKHRRPR